MRTNQQDTDYDPKPETDILTAIYAPLQYVCTCGQFFVKISNLTSL